VNLNRARELLEAWQNGAATEADLAELRVLLPAVFDRLAKLETAARAACESCPEFRVEIEHADAIYTLRDVLDKP